MVNSGSFGGTPIFRNTLMLVFDAGIWAANDSEMTDFMIVWWWLIVYNFDDGEWWLRMGNGSQWWFNNAW